MSGIISTPIIYYIKNWIKNKTKVDMNKEQNIDLIKRINVDTVFIYSS